jgi:hypothetical protein
MNARFKAQALLLRILRVPTFGIGFLLEIYRYLLSQLRRVLLFRRSRVIEVLADQRPTQVHPPRLLVVITQIVSANEATSVNEGQTKIDRLSRSIDAVLKSFAHCDIKLILNTMPGRHVAAFLPDYQRNLLRIKEQTNCDPMFVEFKAQDEFIQCVDDFDWFLFIEDDILVQDSCFLDKLTCFNQHSGNLHNLLMPHRFEMWNGSNTYIDFSYSDRDKTASFRCNSLSTIQIGDTKFSEFQNPHSAIYCLSQSQLRAWMKSGRFWAGQEIMVGPLESAATFCLAECFSLYKPHPDNLHFLEVEHWDTKYSQQMCMQETQKLYQLT